MTGNRIHINRTAIDHASNRCRGLWHQSKLKGVAGDEDEGLATWLQRMALGAIKDGEALESGKIRYQGMKFVISGTPEAPVLISVERVRE